MRAYGETEGVITIRVEGWDRVRLAWQILLGREACFECTIMASGDPRLVARLATGERANDRETN